MRGMRRWWSWDCATYAGVTIVVARRVSVGREVMMSVRAVVVVAIMVVEGWRRVEQKVLAAWESLLPGCQKR